MFSSKFSNLRLVFFFRRFQNQIKYLIDGIRWRCGWNSRNDWRYRSQKRIHANFYTLNAKIHQKLMCNVHTITNEQLGHMNSLESLAFLCRNERFRSSYLAAGYTFFSSAIFVRFLGTPLRYLESVCIDRITIFIGLMCHPFWKTVISLLMSHGDMDCVHENLLMYS